MHTNAYTFRFAAIVTLVCSVLLASAATLLKSRQAENEVLDIKKNILISVGVQPDNGEAFTRSEIQKKYTENINESVIDENGNIVEGKKPENLNPKVDLNQYPLYEHVDNGQVLAYIIPISGKGLWSTIYGYLAIDIDGVTIHGITFYKHGETPGLGGEIDKTWFTDNFKGKRIADDNGNLVSIGVVKGKVTDKIPEEDAYHYVDGISGATLTGRGVEQFLKKDLKTYEPFFNKVKERKQEGVI
ncbi:MAG: NADH:ubiquinone reductase (Na(+)-transporting) subunit C [Calditrichaceae bacterium]